MNKVNIATFVLDDDQDLLDDIKEAIDAAGIDNYRLFTSEDLFLGELNKDIHVCVVDHILPKKTGLDILDIIKERNKDSYVIAYTGMKDPMLLIQYIKKKINMFVDKNEEGHLQELVKYIKVGIGEAQDSIDFKNFLQGLKELKDTRI